MITQILGPHIGFLRILGSLQSLFASAQARAVESAAVEGPPVVGQLVGNMKTHVIIGKMDLVR